MHAPAIETTALDTTGAGDLLVAAYIWGDLRGASPEECLRWAVLYAGLSVATPTGVGGAVDRGAPARGRRAARAHGTPLGHHLRLGPRMRARGLEPPRARAHRNLNPARLPVPPRPREPTVADARVPSVPRPANHLRCGSCEDDDHHAGRRPCAAGGGARGRSGSSTTCTTRSGTSSTAPSTPVSGTGKVPPAVVLQRMGREEVFEETMREFLPSWVGEAIAESRLHPADRPSVDFETVPARGRVVHVHGGVPAAPDGHAAGRARSSRACRRRSTSPPRRSTPRSSACARSPRRSSPSSARRRRATSSRSTCTSAPAASRCPRPRRSATSCSSAPGARSRRSSARCAA